MFSLQLKDIIVAAILFATTFICKAQSYKINPDDSIVGTATMDNLSVLNIQQDNITTDTLHIGWIKIMDSIPSMWEVTLCDNQYCYPGLPKKGMMDQVPPGSYGILSLHVTPHSNSGVAIIQYAVWETKNPLVNDTLTWIINATITGTKEEKQNLTTVYTSSNTLFVQTNNEHVKNVRIVNINGVISKEFLISGTQMQFDISDLAKGIYLVYTNNIPIHPKKILIE